MENLKAYMPNSYGEWKKDVWNLPYPYAAHHYFRAKYLWKGEVGF